MPLSSCRFAPDTLSALEPSVHSAIKEYLSFSDPTIFTTAIECVQEGGGEEQIKERLGTILDSRKATKLAGKISRLVDDFCIEHDLPTLGNGEQKTRKRKGEQDKQDSPSSKMPRATDASGPPPVSAMSSDQIRQMMENARKEIAARKQQLTDTKANLPQVGPMKPAEMPVVGEDKAKALAALQAQIASRMSKVSDKLPVPDKPTPVILDSHGRTVDASGQQIQLSHHVPTLKANLRAKKRDAMKEHLKETPTQANQAVQESKFFDPRVVGKGAQRTKRSFKFNEPGKFQLEGQRLRMKTQLERLQADISTIARRTGITSATQLAKLVPKDALRGRIPDVEWWDSHILENNNYDDPVEFREGAITNLIEHPIQMMPLEPNKPIHVPVFLTKKERKKLRRQSRREAWKEKQDKIRLGLVTPDEPRVKMSNLMRVLGTEAVQDPTKVEAHVRAQMAKRLANHEKANQERKLTTEQRKEKMVNKIKEDTSCGVHVAVFRVKSLHNPAKKFKVETNAKQLFMTGCIILYEDVNIVVVEGGPKQMKKYKQLMLHRIKWDDEIYKDKEGVELENSCDLVWEGQTKERHFGEMRFKQCPTESFARDYFKKQGVEHYWDQAYSAAVLEATENI